MKHLDDGSIQSLWDERNAVLVSEPIDCLGNPCLAKVVQFLSVHKFPARCEELSLEFSLSFKEIPELNNRFSNFRVLGIERDFEVERLFSVSGFKEEVEADRDYIFSYICLNIEDCSIYSVSKEIDNDICFINKDINSFRYSLIAHQKTLISIENVDDDDLLFEATNRLKDNILKVDSRAFASEENWWPQFFDNVFV